MPVFCLQLYKDFAATYKHWFEFLLPRSNQKLVTGHHPSNRSFKIVAECPVIGTDICVSLQVHAIFVLMSLRFLSVLELRFVYGLALCEHMHPMCVHLQ